METAVPLTSTKLSTLSNVRHAFCTRQGGTSEGLYASLNCGYGSGDERDAVRQNRIRAAALLGLPEDRLVTAYQVHSAEVVTVERPWRPDDAPKADGMVTNVPGLALGILAADCGPLLFADGEAGVVGAAHAGWKGALTGVAEATVAAMEALGADRRRMRAVLGPCISLDAYEVGPEFFDRFEKDDPRSPRFFRKSLAGDRFHFDLPRYIMHRLKGLGIPATEHVPQCTYFNEAKFFSYRRSVHRGETDYGRNISLVALAEAG